MIFSKKSKKTHFLFLKDNFSYFDAKKGISSSSPKRLFNLFLLFINATLRKLKFCSQAICLGFSYYLI
ncbi:hypothetical protein AZK08_07785 [Streptococcus pneumoniae]|nr:hypothetical protein AZK08_07785 [Streptococcus pneumoniae]